MIDITIIGGGAAARACSDLLSAAGFGLHRSIDFDAEDRGPIVLGEVPGAATIARRAVDSGRHLLIANPEHLPVDQIDLLYAARREHQALYLWSARRAHPSYRFIRGLVESDPTWQPRYLRHQTLLTSAPAIGLTNWTVVEAAALVIHLVGERPLAVAASAAANPLRNAHELVDMTVQFPRIQAFLQVGLGEAVDRRETLIAGTGRKAYVDELNTSMPLRLITDDPRNQMANPARWLSTTPPTAEEAARQQCIAFLDATLNPSQASDEASLWIQALAVVSGARESLASSSATVHIDSEGPSAPANLIPYRALA